MNTDDDDDEVGWGDDVPGISAQNIGNDEWEDVVEPREPVIKRETTSDDDFIERLLSRERPVLNETSDSPPSSKTARRVEQSADEFEGETDKSRKTSLRQRMNSEHWKRGHDKRKDKPIYKHSTKMPLEKFTSIYEVSKKYIFPLYKFFAEGGLVNGKLEYIDARDYDGPNFRDYNNREEEKGNERTWNSFALKIYDDFKRNRGNCQVLTAQNKFQEDIHQQNDESEYIYPDQILRYHRFRINDKENRAALARSQQLKLEETGARYKKRQRRHMENIKSFLFDSGNDWEMNNWYKQRGIEDRYENLKKEWNDWKNDNIDIFQENFKIYFDKNSNLYYILVKQYDGDTPVALGTLEYDGDKYWVHTLDDLLKSVYATAEIVTVQDKLKEIYGKDRDAFIENFADVSISNDRDIDVDQYLSNLLDEPAPAIDQYLSDLLNPSSPTPSSSIDLSEEDLLNLPLIPPPVKDGSKKLSEEEKRSRKNKRMEESKVRREMKSQEKRQQKEAKRSLILKRGSITTFNTTKPIIRRRSIQSRYDIVNQDRQVLLDIPMNRPYQQPGEKRVVNKNNASMYRGIDQRCGRGSRMRSKYCKKIKESNDEEDVYVTGYGYKGKCPTGSEYAIKECEGYNTAEHNIFRKADLRYFSRPPKYTLRNYIDGGRRSQKVKRRSLNPVRSVKKKNPVRSVKKNPVRSVKKKSPKKNKFFF